MSLLQIYQRVCQRKNSETIQARRQEMKWGRVFGKKKLESGGVFLYKKRTFPQRRVHYVHYQYFLFYILLIWGGGCVGCRRTPPAHGPAIRYEMLL